MDVFRVTPVNVLTGQKAPSIYIDGDLTTTSDKIAESAKSKSSLSRFGKWSFDLYQVKLPFHQKGKSKF